MTGFFIEHCVPEETIETSLFGGFVFFASGTDGFRKEVSLVLFWPTEGDSISLRLLGAGAETVRTVC